MQKLIVLILLLSCFSVNKNKDIFIHFLQKFVKFFFFFITLSLVFIFEITLTNGGYSEIKNALNDGASDIGFINLSANDNFKCFPLIQDEMLAILPVDHPLAKLDAIDVKYFERESVISLGDKTDDDSRAVFENSNVKPNIK